MKRLAVLGATGSIGRSALEVAAELRGEIRIEGLAAGTSWRKLAEQCRAAGLPRLLAMANAESARLLEKELKLPAGRVLAGAEGVARLAADPDVDVVLTAMVGAEGLRPTLAAIEAGHVLALANKEPLVMAGALVMAAARQRGARIIPVDSEHSAVFQLLGAGGAEIRKIVLCGSGGPFRTWPAERIARATVAEALKHPTWDMGPKITVDSATLMNKALEVIEAHWLFGVEADRIEVLIQPQSLVHAMVEFADGTLLAHLSKPDMRLPIRYALAWPARRASAAPCVGAADLAGLSFEAPDAGRFPALALGYRALRAGGTAGAALNGANEAAVRLFLDGKLRFGDIPRLVAAALDAHEPQPAEGLDAVLAADAWAREFVARSSRSSS